MYKSVKISKGSSGFGGPLYIKITDEKNKVVSITGGGIDDVTKYIADLTGAVAVDGFNTGVPEEEIACVVVNCGGTARCGVYPKKRIPTINLVAVGAAGPLAAYILEDIYVSDVTVDCVELADEGEAPAQESADLKKDVTVNKPSTNDGLFVRIGKGVGGVVNKFYQSGRETIDMVIKNILPFMAFVAMLIGIIEGTGLGGVIARTISPFAGTLPGLIIIAAICAIPIISPIIGPGAVIAQVVGVMVGQQIAVGAISPSLALPALFAINAQVGCDFIPVGLSLAEAEPETINAGVPAVLFSRLVTGPAAVVIAYLFSIGMY